MALVTVVGTGPCDCCGGSTVPLSCCPDGYPSKLCCIITNVSGSLFSNMLGRSWTMVYHSHFSSFADDYYIYKGTVYDPHIPGGEADMQLNVCYYHPEFPHPVGGMYLESFHGGWSWYLPGDITTEVDCTGNAYLSWFQESNPDTGCDVIVTPGQCQDCPSGCVIPEGRVCTLTIPPTSPHGNAGTYHTTWETDCNYYVGLTEDLTVCKPGCPAVGWAVFTLADGARVVVHTSGVDTTGTPIWTFGLDTASAGHITCSGSSATVTFVGSFYGDAVFSA